MPPSGGRQPHTQAESGVQDAKVFGNHVWPGSTGDKDMKEVQGEMPKESNMQKMHIANAHCRLRKPATFYNLDVLTRVVVNLINRRKP
jgi:hypothetical protein